METTTEKELSLRDLLQIHHRRRRIIYRTLLFVGVLAALYCTVCTRRYEAKAVIQLEKESADAMGLDSLMSSAAGGAGDALNANIDLQTQANILQSDTLAIRTIEDLQMERTRDFNSRWNLVSALLETFSPRGLVDVPGARLEDSPQRRQRALKIFSKNLKVKPVGGTRLIEISYMNPDPKLAAAVVNTLTKELADYSFQTRYNATSQASKWLSDQMGDLRKSSAELQAKVVNLQRESGVYSFGTADAEGKERAYSGVLDRLQQDTAALTAAQQNRILKGAIAQAADGGDAELLSGLAGNGNSQTMNNSLALIQNLRQQEATQQAALKQAEAKFGASYPKLDELRSSLASLDRSLQQEIERVRARAKGDYAVALQTEAGTRNEFIKAKNEADTLNNRAIDYEIAREEAEQSRSLYQDLLKRLNEAGVLEGLHSSNVTVVDPGRVPAKATKPNVPVYMMIALLGGWVLGCFGALLVDSLDNKINTITDLESQIGTASLGALPLVERKPTLLTAKTDTETLISIEHPESTYVESLRAIRTALLLSQSDAPPKVMLVTSSLAGEGKSTASLNLAVALAQTGRRTLLVDTDLRRGTIRRRLALAQGGFGLSDLLTRNCSKPHIHRVPEVPNLEVLSAGCKSPNPSELLGSESMKSWLERWKSEYDFIVLDSAPVLPVTDSVTLNTLADVTLLLARVGITERQQICRSYQMLRRGGKHYVGVVLNGLRVSDSSYYGYYGYRKNGYGSQEAD